MNDIALAIRETGGNIELVDELTHLLRSFQQPGVNSYRKACHWMAENGFPRYLNTKGEPKAWMVSYRLKKIREFAVSKAESEYAEVLGGALCELQSAKLAILDCLRNAPDVKTKNAVINTYLRAIELEANLQGVSSTDSLPTFNNLTNIQLNL